MKPRKKQLVKRCKHYYVDALIHWSDPFWGEEFYLGRICTKCGKRHVDTLPVEDFRFLTPEETIDRYPDYPIAEDDSHEFIAPPVGFVDTLGYKYDLYWETDDDGFGGYVIRDKNGRGITSWVVPNYRQEDEKRINDDT